MNPRGLAVRALGAYGALNGYWGQWGNENLRTYCDSGIDYVTLSFVNQAPEHDLAANYPGTNFAGHCSAGVFYNGTNASKLLSKCDEMKKDIPYCRSKGVKVLLSIGGHYNETTSNYLVTSKANGQYFASFLYRAFGPWDSTWTGPRPFDLSSTNHTQVDGFDFDIEAMFDNDPYIAMADTFRSLSPSIILTAAPQCPTSDAYFHLKKFISQASLDALFVQFYNNPVCDAVAGNMAGESFNYDQWASILASSAKSKNAKLFIGLPASTEAAGSGYITPQAMKDLVCKWKGGKNFGGISLWDLTRGAGNVVNGKTYNQHVLDALAGGCPATTTTTTMSTATRTSTTTRAPTSTGNGIATPTPTQPTIVSNCNKFYLVKSGEDCATVAKKNGITVSLVKTWNPSAGSACTNLWANAYACVSTIGYTPPLTTTCGSTAKTWGDNKPAALQSVVSWCDGNANTDGTGAYTIGQTKNGCFNAPLGTNKFLFSARNDFGIATSLPKDKCERIIKAAINNCTRGATGTLESWWFKAEVVAGRC
ncbi:glycoside hydrolase superfamily [Stachybotrys elegans]|uniref:Glycoside hydrolase superfamily n=1 Tax=Stachybotrys elegans TaxID=80388 RepID=A0A8K0WJ99_9HYPO|nr:glycoside hydrolase superfamily [Stachybotrys elegans]